MRRFLPLPILLAALSGCASVTANAPQQHQQRSYWESVGDGVIDPRAAFGPVSVIWLHPPYRAQAPLNP